VYLSWSIEEYADTLTSSQNIRSAEHEQDLFRRFPPLFSSVNGALLPLQDEPCTIVDSKGIIVLWYVPNAITRARNVCI